MAGGDASTGAGAEEPAEVDAGFEFAFDNEAFSDKVLRIEVIGGEEDAPGSGADAASRKRRRDEAEGDDGKDIDCCTVMGPVLRVKNVHVSSAVLAAKSPFFLKLFSNGMKESDQKQATVRIVDSEENAFMELLCFIYSGKLAPTTEPTLLIDILIAADKYEVVSCMKLCSQRLTGLHMTLESAMLCLELPSSISMAADLAEAAKKFLVETSHEFLSTKSQDELMRIPLAGIEAKLVRLLGCI